MEEILVSNLYSEPDLPITGPAVLYIFTNDDDEDPKAVALMVNLCAALWDATTMRSIFQTFMNLLESQTSTIYKSPSTKDLYTQLGGWEERIQEEASNEKNISDPLFLQMGENIVAITDILKGPPATSPIERRISATLEAKVVEGCRRVMDSHGVTLEGLTNACFVYALAETYFRERATTTNEPSSVTLVQTTQLDPRTLLGDNGHSSGSTNHNNRYIQAIGTISQASNVTKKEWTETSQSSSLVVDWLVAEAKRADADRQVRLQRGEGLHRTVELATGQIDRNHSVAACLEVVDHGIYNTPSEDYEIELGHRMDICPHMTIVVHMERASGKRKLQVQLGIEQGREATLQWLERCIELWKEVAACSS